MTEERIVKVSGECDLTDEEIRVLITRANEAKRYKDAEVLFSFTSGEMVVRGKVAIRGTQAQAPLGPVIELGGGKPLPPNW